MLPPELDELTPQLYSWICRNASKDLDNLEDFPWQAVRELNHLMKSDSRN